VTTPSSILVTAADRVRDLAAAATPGPWETIHETGGIWREASPKRALRTAPGSLGSMDAAEDARWIAALSPAVVDTHPTPDMNKRPPSVSEAVGTQLRAEPWSATEATAPGPEVDTP
jgi:hypothetical protein